MIQEKKLSQKPWITTGIVNPIKNKNRKYRKCFIGKDAGRKESLHKEFKSCCKKLDKIIKA